jgi:hypothetical protein
MQVITKMDMKKVVDRSVLQDDTLTSYSVLQSKPCDPRPFERKLVSFLKRANLDDDRVCQAGQSLILLRSFIYAALSVSFTRLDPRNHYGYYYQSYL